jgi:threonine aldolase
MQTRRAASFQNAVSFSALGWNAGKWSVVASCGHANSMAQRLATALAKWPQIEIPFPVQTNAVFAKFPAHMVEGLHELGWRFYTGVVTPDESRLMCSWDTSAEDVDAFVADIGRLMGKFKARPDSNVE